MKYRKKAAKFEKKRFSRTVTKSNKRNAPHRQVMRGGIRL